MHLLSPYHSLAGILYHSLAGFERSVAQAATPAGLRMRPHSPFLRAETTSEGLQHSQARLTTGSGDAAASAAPSPETAPGAAAHNGGPCNAENRQADHGDPRKSRRTPHSAASTARHAAGSACAQDAPASTAATPQHSTPYTTNSSRSTSAGSAGTPRTAAPPRSSYSGDPVALSSTAAPNRTRPPKLTPAQSSCANVSREKLAGCPLPLGFTSSTRPPVARCAATLDVVGQSGIVALGPDLDTTLHHVAAASWEVRHLFHVWVCSSKSAVNLRSGQLAVFQQLIREGCQRPCELP